MVNLYSEIVNFDGVNFQDHLERVGLSFVFDPIIHCSDFDDNQLQIKVCQYIVFAFSLESPKLTIAGDRRTETASIFRELKLPDSIYGSLVLLNHEKVLESAKRWMKKQDNAQIEYLFTLKEAYVQQQTASLQDLKNSSGETDYVMKMKCIENMVELKKMIKEAESELQQNDERLKSAHNEIKKSTSKFTIGVENFAK